MYVWVLEQYLTTKLDECIKYTRVSICGVLLYKGKNKDHLYYSTQNQHTDLCTGTPVISELIAQAFYAAVFMAFILSHPYSFRLHFMLPILFLICAIYKALVGEVCSYVVVKSLQRGHSRMWCRTAPLC